MRAGRTAVWPPVQEGTKRSHMPAHIEKLPFIRLDRLGTVGREINKFSCPNLSLC